MSSPVTVQPAAFAPPGPLSGMAVHALQSAAPFLHRTSRPVTGTPPCAPAVQSSAARPLPASAARPVGAAGGVGVGVASTPFEGAPTARSAPLPATARIRNPSSVPLVRPVIAAESIAAAPVPVSVTASALHTCPCRLTSQPVMPGSAGFGQESVTRPSPAAAEGSGAFAGRTDSAKDALPASPSASVAV